MSKFNQYIFLLSLSLFSINIAPKAPTESSFPEKCHDEAMQKNLHPILQKKEVSLKTISIKNAITSEMLTYNHWSGNYLPDPFSVEINGEPLQQGKEKICTFEKNEIEVVYKYSFAKGLYKGTRSCKVSIPKNVTHAALTFSWNEEPRVWLQASPQKVTG